MESISISHFIIGNISTGHESVCCDCLGSQVVHPGCFLRVRIIFVSIGLPSYWWFRVFLFVVFLYYLVKFEFSLISDWVL